MSSESLPRLVRSTLRADVPDLISTQRVLLRDLLIIRSTPLTEKHLSVSEALIDTGVGFPRLVLDIVWPGPEILLWMLSKFSIETFRHKSFFYRSIEIVSAKRFLNEAKYAIIKKFMGTIVKGISRTKDHPDVVVDIL